MMGALGMASTLLSLRNVDKAIPGKIVLDDVSLNIERGHILAVVGANGSGKSTMLKIVSALGRFDKGKRIAERDEGALSIGYVPERFPKLNFNAVEYLRGMGRMQDIPKVELEARIGQLMERFGLDPGDRRTMRNYSKGMLQKVNLIQALLSTPDLLLLDEPFSGLDQHAQEELIGFLRKLKRQGQAIVLTTHEPSFIERVADTVMRLQNGRLSLLAHQESRTDEVIKRLEYLLPDSTALHDHMHKVKDLRDAGSKFIALVGIENSDSILRVILEAGGSILSVGDERTGSAL